MRNLQDENGNTFEISLFRGADGFIYINSHISERARALVALIGQKEGELIDIHDRSRMYNGLSGYLVNTGRKSFSAVVRRIWLLSRTNEQVQYLLEYSKFSSEVKK